VKVTEPWYCVNFFKPNIKICVSVCLPAGAAVDALLTLSAPHVSAIHAGKANDRAAAALAPLNGTCMAFNGNQIKEF
jgi:hypothetical protein